MSTATPPPQHNIYANETPIFQQTWKQRILYRKDGTSRSKLRGAWNLALLSVFLWILSSTAEMVDDLHEACFALEFLFHAQRTEYAFRGADLNDYGVAADFFLELVRPFITVEAHGGEPGLSIEDALKQLTEETFPAKEVFHQAIQETGGKLRALLNPRGQGKEGVQGRLGKVEQERPIVDVAEDVRDVLNDFTEKLNRMTDTMEQLSFKMATSSSSSGKRGDKEKEKEKGYEVVG